jgi:hypothetical protein
LVGVGLDVLRVKRNDVIAIVGGLGIPEHRRASIARTVYDATGAIVIFLPSRCSATVEQARLETEDRGYRKMAGGST